MRYGDDRRSAIKQVASGRFGVNAHYLANADELQIKMAQGAKPGEGGQLPGPQGRRLHRERAPDDAGRRADLAAAAPRHLLDRGPEAADLRPALRESRSARISVKLVAEVGVGTVAAGVAKAGADHVLISGHDGGTGAAPLSSILHAGIPWEIGLAETQQTLMRNDLRSRIWVQTDGQLKTGRDVVIAALLGADEMGFATAPLIATGCVMMRACHLNTCPVGIATQDPELRAKFAGQAGARRQLLLLRRRGGAPDHGAARRSRASTTSSAASTCSRSTRRSRSGASAASTSPRSCTSPSRTAPRRRTRGAAARARRRARPPADRGGARTRCTAARAVDGEFAIANRNRTVGGLLSHAVTRAHGAAGLPAGTIRFTLRGSAGQSFGAWLAPGIELTLVGDANDYVGKGLSGGVLALRPPDGAAFRAEENVDRRQHDPLRRDRRPGVLPRPRRRAVRRAQLGRDARSSRASATTAAST